MTEPDIAAIERACTALCIAYARAIDFRDQDGFVALFTEDAVLDVGQALQGRAAIRESIDRRPDELRSRHVISNVFIDVLSPDEARGISYLTLYRHRGAESAGFGRQRSAALPRSATMKTGTSAPTPAGCFVPGVCSSHFLIRSNSEWGISPPSPSIEARVGADPDQPR